MPRDYRDITGKKNHNYKTGLKCKDNKEQEGIYNSWQNMKGRCLRPSHPKYQRYGGRGIKVCKEWMDIKGFYNWAVSAGWEKGSSIDRIDNDGDYCPENCQWISVSENSRKKSTSKLTRKDADIIRSRINSGESEYDLANEYGVVHGTIWFIKKGYTHVNSGECAKLLKERDEKNKG